MGLKLKGEAKPIILKLGGSIVTNKAKPYTFLDNIVKRIACEIYKAKPEGLVIVHGGGSFGHPIAKKFNLVSGFSRHNQLEGFVKTRQAMVSLNKLIMDELTDAGLKAASIQPSAFIVTRNRRIVTFNIAVIQRMLNLGLIPVLYGDAVIDSVKGFTILSGDQIVTKLALMLKCKRIILACDVDGVYTDDPKTEPKAKLIRKLTLTDLKEKVKTNRASEISDVTGLMKGKLEELSSILGRDVKIVIVNGLKQERIYKALKQLGTQGTIISLQ